MYVRLLLLIPQRFPSAACLGINIREGDGRLVGRTLVVHGWSVADIGLLHQLHLDSVLAIHARPLGSANHVEKLLSRLWECIQRVGVVHPSVDSMPVPSLAVRTPVPRFGVTALMAKWMN